MNKYLMLMAAALTATASPTSLAQAGHASIILSGSFCSHWVLDWKGRSYVANIVGYSCNSAVAHEIGIAGKTNGTGKNVNFDFPAMTGFSALSVDLQLPVKTGNRWTMYADFDGSVIVAQYGTYAVINGGRTNSGSRTSVRERLKKLLVTRGGKGAR